MWPWGHLAVAYLCFVGYTRVTNELEQTGATVTAVAVGSQFPDLIDKTLAWPLPVLPSGRSLGHSLLFIILVVVVASRIAGRYDRVTLVPAFAIGLVTHTLVDLGPGVIGGLLTGDLAQLEWTTYLLWPLLESPPYVNDDSFREHIFALALTPYTLAELALSAVAGIVWLGQGRPGLRDAKETAQRWQNHY